MSFVVVALGTAAVGAISGIGGAMISGNAAENAAETQAAAGDRASQLQYQMFQQQRGDQAPWREAGVRALGSLEDPNFQKDFTMADYQQDPGYQFRMAEGQKALERSAAAKGSLMSGGFMKGLTRYGQDVASQEYGNAYNRFNADRDRRFNRLSSIAGIGQTANNQVGAAGQNYANQVGNIGMGVANAQGAAGIAGANAWSGALSGIGNNAMNYSLYSGLMNNGTGGGGGGFGGVPSYNSYTMPTFGGQFGGD
jgi:hypothetical protein